MIYFIVTTCLLDNNFEIRKQQYINSISYILEYIKHKTNVKIIIVENNGQRATFLDDFASYCNILYTNNNSLNSNMGGKELQDVLDCIKTYNIADDDFIVKITGRYLLQDNSPFLQALENLENIHCLIRYGSYMNPVDYKTTDCITGLIGLLCKYVKQINFPLINECVEWNWAKVTYLIADDKIKKLNLLGIKICPGSIHYFLV